MIILSIETSCDETALSIVETNPEFADEPRVRVLSNVLISQVKIHEEYGGVFPVVAKREHAKNLTPLLHKALLEAGLYVEHDESEIAQKGPIEPHEYSADKDETLVAVLAREEGLFEQLKRLLVAIERPTIDRIAVTAGPGLEPALWVGISFAKALGIAWDIPVLPMNHMEGHIASVLLSQNTSLEKTEAAHTQDWQTLRPIAYPALALLISGGHTELVLANGWHHYKVIGKTEDDAVGEAFDKVARLLELPYPGGPEISRLAEIERKVYQIPLSKIEPSYRLPRPMLHSDSLDFSFSGLKTAVRYMIEGGQKNQKDSPTKFAPKELNLENKARISREFEDSVTEVLVAKTLKALEQHDCKTLILGGGVTANKHIREAFEDLAKARHITLLMPDASLSTDNALMIALAACFAKPYTKNPADIKAEGNLSL